MRNNRGFSVVEVVVLLAVLVIIGALGYVAYNNLILNNDSQSASSDESALTADSLTSPVVIKSSSDLDKIAEELDSLSLEDSDSNTQYDKAVSSF